MSADPGSRLPGAPGTARFAFSRNGRYGASVGISGAASTLETWCFDTGQPTREVVLGMQVQRDACVLPLDDRALLLAQHATSEPAHYELTALPAFPSRGRTVRLGTVPAVHGYLLPAPAGWQVDGIAVTLDSAEHSTLWGVSGRPPMLERLLRVPGVLSGGTWIDEDAGRLAVNQTLPAGRPNGIVVDLSVGTWRQIWSVSRTSSDHIVCCAPATGRMVVSSTASGEARLGWGVLGQRPVHFSETLYRAGFPRSALGFDEYGERLLVHERDGAVSRLYIYTPADDRLLPLEVPPGVVTSPVSWVGDEIRIPYSHPARPPTIATIRDRPSRRTAGWSVPTAPAHRPTVPAELVHVVGDAGSMEAVVYGGPRWRYRRHLVVALHGGPLAAWRFEFEPLFQRLALAGIAVLAPNYRGSTGYGSEFRDAVLGHWGGPDLDDVHALGRWLNEQRATEGLARPALLGVSYGAFLALLAASTEPPAWSGCVALAPFLSAPALRRAAAGPVRRRIDELGMTGNGDPAGQPDVLHACSSLSVPLLLVHGRRDDRIPVEQSRTLRRRLLELGKPDIDYLEPDTDHEGVITHRPPALLRRITRFCLTCGGLSGNMPGQPRKARTERR